MELRGRRWAPASSTWRPSHRRTCDSRLMLRQMVSLATGIGAPGCRDTHRADCHPFGRPARPILSARADRHPKTRRALVVIPKDFPPVVYVPCLVDPATGSMNVMLRTTTDGRAALLAYSAFDRLHAGAGADIPWALLSIEDLQRVHDEIPYDVLYLDLRIPQEARSGAVS